MLENDISDSLSYHYQFDHVRVMLQRHHTAQSLGSSLRIWKSTFLRPMTGWNLSFEDIKSSILALVRVTLLKKRGHARIEV